MLRPQIDNFIENKAGERKESTGDFSIHSRLIGLLKYIDPYLKNEFTIDKIKFDLYDFTNRIGYEVVDGCLNHTLVEYMDCAIKNKINIHFVVTPHSAHSKTLPFICSKLFTITLISEDMYIEMRECLKKADISLFNEKFVNILKEVINIGKG